MPVYPSKLDPRVQDLMEIIFDGKMMAKTVTKLNYDVQKKPLGNLSTQVLKQGLKVLKQIEDMIKTGIGSKAKYVALSNEFYTHIPHNYGFAKLPVIDTLAMIKEKLELLEILEDVEFASKVVLDETSSKIKQKKMNILDIHFESLKTSITPISKSSDEWKWINQYVQNTHAPTHDEYKMKVMDVFEIDREAERKNFDASIGNRQFLWHGSRMTNWVGILSQGLRIAPPEAPVTGYMFGKGVYFADVSSKSANYCCTTKEENTVSSFAVCSDSS